MKFPSRRWGWGSRSAGTIARATEQTRGRRPRAGVASLTRIEFLVTPEERSRLLEVAQHNRGSVAGVIRDAVNTYVNDYGERVVFPAAKKE